MILKTMTNRLYRARLPRKNTLFFCILFGRGDLLCSDWECMFFLFFMLLIVISMLWLLDGSDFLLLFFELFVDLVGIMSVRL